MMTPSHYSNNPLRSLGCHRILSSTAAVRVFLALALLGVLEMMIPSAKSATTNFTWTSAGYWTNSATNWSPGTAWDATSGSNSIAVFTNTTTFTIGIAPTAIYLNGLSFTNGGTNIPFNIGSNNQIGQGTLNFQASGATIPTIALGTNDQINIYSSIVLTNTLTISGGSGASINLYGPNFFTNGTWNEVAGNLNLARPQRSL